MHKLCTCTEFTMLFFKETKQISIVICTTIGTKFLAQVFADICGRSVRSLHYMHNGDYEFLFVAREQYLSSQASKANYHLLTRNMFDNARASVLALTSWQRKSFQLNRKFFHHKLKRNLSAMQGLLLLGNYMATSSTQEFT